MGNRKNKRRSTIQPNLYGLGSDIKKAWKKASTTDKLTGGLGAASGIFGALSGGTETTMGNTLSGVGNVMSAIPGVGGIVGAGLSAVGQLGNVMFGSKINDSFVAQTKSNIENQANYQWDANTNDDLISQWQDYSPLEHVRKDSIGKDGWFSNKAGRLTNRLNNQIDDANNRALASFERRTNNVDAQNDLAMIANFAALGGHLFGDGGGIHIKKKNRGKFTEYCGGKVTNTCIQKGLHSSNPTTRKRANFARNARKWHAFGGELGTNGADWTNGINFFNVGGSHEENPNQGIPQGVDQNGVPNLVEEGEVKFEDYIFSNRIKADKSILELVGLPATSKGKTYAQLARKASEESIERPNDPISIRGLNDSMIKLQTAQEIQREEDGTKRFSKGGNLHADGRKLNIARSEGIMTPALQSSIDSDLAGYSIMPNPIDDLPTIRKEVSRYDRPAPAAANTSLPTWMRYVPAMGGALGAMATALTPVDAPDYRDADSIVRARRTVGYTPITERLTYRPFDRDYYTNKLNAQAGATRRSLANASGGNRATLIAALTGADYNAQNQLGDLFRQSEEYNQAQRERVQAFNRGTSQANSQMSMQAQQANAELAMRAAQDAARLRQAELQRYRMDQAAKRDAIGANLSNLFESLGGIGQENYWRNSLQGLRDAGILQAMISGSGNIVRAKGGKVKRKNNKLKVNI